MPEETLAGPPTLHGSDLTNPKETSGEIGRVQYPSEDTQHSNEVPNTLSGSDLTRPNEDTYNDFSEDVQQPPQVDSISANSSASPPHSLDETRDSGPSDDHTSIQPAGQNVEIQSNHKSAQWWWCWWWWWCSIWFNSNSNGGDDYLGPQPLDEKRGNSFDIKRTEKKVEHSIAVMEHGQYYAQRLSVLSYTTALLILGAVLTVCVGSILRFYFYGITQSFQGVQNRNGRMSQHQNLYSSGLSYQTQGTQEGYLNAIEQYRQLLGENGAYKEFDINKTYDWVNRRERSYLMCLIAYNYYQLYNITISEGTPMNNSYFNLAEHFFAQWESLYEPDESPLYDHDCLVHHGDLHYLAKNYHKAAKCYQKTSGYVTSLTGLNGKFLNEILWLRQWGASVLSNETQQAVKYLEYLKNSDQLLPNFTAIAVDITFLKMSSSKLYNQSETARIFNLLDEVTRTISISATYSIVGGFTLLKTEALYFSELQRNGYSEMKDVVLQHLILKHDSCGYIAFYEGNYNACIYHNEKELELITRSESSNPILKIEALKRIGFCDYHRYLRYAPDKPELKSMRRIIQYFQKAERLLVNNSMEYNILNQAHYMIHALQKDAIWHQNTLFSYYKRSRISDRPEIFDDFLYVEFLMAMGQFQSASGLIYRMLDRTKPQYNATFLESWLACIDVELKLKQYDVAYEIGDRFFYWLTTSKLDILIGCKLKLKLCIVLLQDPIGIYFPVKWTQLLKNIALNIVSQCESLLDETQFLMFHSFLAMYNDWLEQFQTAQVHLNVVLNELTKTDTINIQTAWSALSMLLKKWNPSNDHGFDIRHDVCECEDCLWLAICQLMIEYDCPNSARVYKVYQRIDKKGVLRYCPNHPLIKSVESWLEHHNQPPTSTLYSTKFSVTRPFFPRTCRIT